MSLTLFNLEGARSKRDGGIAQLGEHLLCKQGVNGSIPLVSTKESGSLKRFETSGVFKRDAASVSKRSLKIWKRSKAFNRRRAVLMRHGEPKKAIGTGCDCIH